MSVLIQPELVDERFIADVAQAQSERSDEHRFDLWWLGQSGFLIGWRDRHLLIDPYLSDSLTRKYSGTDKPHVRMSARVVDPALLNLVDVVACTHAHTDHLDPDTLQAVLTASPNTAIVAPEAERALVAKRARVDLASPLGMDSGDAVSAGGFTVTAVPAAHEQIERDEGLHIRCLGYVFRFGPFAVYHAGDTLLYPGMAETVVHAAGVGGIDAALLPINGRKPERLVAGNMDGTQAGTLARDIQARLAVPCHFQMFEFNTASPRLFIERCRGLEQPYAVLALGARHTVLNRRR